jgi:hypothetical protein
MPIRVLQFGSPAELSEFSTAAKEVTNAAIVSGGTGYEVDDILTVVGGVGPVKATLKVTSETGKVIDGIAVENEGAYTTIPGNPVSVVGGSGNDDATFNLTTGDAVAQSDVVDIEDKDGQWYLFYAV